MYTVYVLWSESTQKIYIGYTSNLDRRLSEHVSPKFGKIGFTHKNGPWKLVYHEKDFPSRKEAMKREKQLKGSKGRNWVKQFISEKISGGSS